MRDALDGALKKLREAEALFPGNAKLKNQIARLQSEPAPADDRAELWARNAHLVLLWLACNGVAALLPQAWFSQPIVRALQRSQPSGGRSLAVLLAGTAGTYVALEHAAPPVTR